MNRKLLKVMVASSIFSCGLANAQVHVRGADGPAAISFFAGVFVNNVESQGISCDQDSNGIIDDILGNSQNKKLIVTINNKNSKNLLKLIGASGKIKDFIDNASVEAANILCGGGEEDGGEEDLPE
jgi:hypothetical protein